MEDVRLTSRTQLNNVDIVDRALAPANAYKPNIPMSLVVAFIVGLVGGVGLALLREFLDDTISSQLDVAAYLKVPFLGLVPRLPEGVSGQEADLFTHFNPRSSIAEAVRGLRAMIEMNPSGPAPRRILVTSSVAREGKTSTTLRLGVSFAQMGKRVVLIDADLRRPRVHKVLGADNSVGLSSFLVGAADAEDIAIPTPVPNLYAICAGPSSDQPAELLGSPKMHELLDLLEKRFDIILLDTPPSVALSDAVTLSRHVDGVLLVVKEQSVSRAVVKQTLDMMKAVDANILGVVLNNVDLQRGGSKYKYYYAYRDYYSNYDDQGPSGDSEKAAK
jgi:capsular exopolysaccharide synthesis family protein